MKITAAFSPLFFLNQITVHDFFILLVLERVSIPGFFWFLCLEEGGRGDDYVLSLNLSKNIKAMKPEGVVQNIFL